MARLMSIPIRDEGHAVLIVTDHAGVTLIGFVTDTTLGGFFEHPPSAPECLMFVEQHLPSFERILRRKSMAEAYVVAPVACVEIGPIDLAGSELAPSLRT
jgi:hypothetical protein